MTNRPATRPPIGLIGLGLMGAALAERLLAAGLAVVGFDVNPKQRRALEKLGGASADSVAEVATSCHRVVLSLPNSTVVAEVVAAMRGKLRRGALLLDTTTGDPQATTRLAVSLRRRGVRYVDATIIGSSADLRAGRALLVMGGAARTIAAASELLDALSTSRLHVGPAGAGARMKLVVNLVLGLNRAVLAEGLAFARRIGVPPARALEVLRAGAAYSRVMDTKGDRMLAGDFRKPVAKLSQHLKDVRLILALGAKHHAKLPLSKLHHRLLEQAEAAGCGELDNSAILRAFA
jgi:3-hydroxyisobutyrate dehydrogenase-like beta-hydroxyacid dehydrogenase